MAYESALVALADPTRRRVFERLKSGPKAVGAIARGMPVSRPAVSQHLKVLKEAGLVADQPDGARRVYYIDPQGPARCARGSISSGIRALAAFQAEVESAGEGPEAERAMTATVTIAPVRKSIRVNASQAHAFDVFTSGLGRWWLRNMGIGRMPMKAPVMETRLGGRWYELAEDGSQATVGKIIVWEPPQRFVMTWEINSQWKPDPTVGSRWRSGSLPTARTRRAWRWSTANSSRWEPKARVDAKGRRWRLAGTAGTVQDRGRGRVSNPTTAASVRETPPECCCKRSTP